MLPAFCTKLFGTQCIEIAPIENFPFGRFCSFSCGKVGELYMNSDLKTFLHVDCSSSGVLVAPYVIVAAVGIHGP